MAELTIWSFLSSTVSVALSAPLAFILLPKWRYSRRVIGYIVSALEVLLAAELLLVYHLLGISLLSTYVIGVLSPLTAVIVLLYVNPLRDSRLAFLLITVFLNTTMCDIISTAIFPRNCPQWLFFYTILLLFESTLICRYCKKPLLNMLSGIQVHWVFTTALPLTLLLALLSYQLHFMRLLGRRTPLLPSLFLCISVVLIYFALYHFRAQLLASARIQQYNSLLQNAIHSLQERQSAAQAADERVRIFRHDTRHILLLIQDRLNHNDIAGAKDLLKRIQEVTQTAAFTPSNVPYTGNAVINTILNQAARTAQHEQVDFKVKLSIPQKLPVSDMELAVVLSNALENAIHAAAQDNSGQSKEVTIQSYPGKQNLFLVISNNYAGELILDELTGLPVSVNQSQEHGYGTLSIYSFAKKYHCSLDCRQKNGRFYLRLLI